MDKRILLFGYGLPLIMILASAIHPLYYYLRCPLVVEATVVSVKEVLIDDPEYTITDPIAEYEYTVNEIKYHQTFGKRVTHPEKTIGQKILLRVDPNNPHRLYYKNTIRGVDIGLFVGGIVLLFAFMVAKKLV